jgi:hypothetical protein
MPAGLLVTVPLPFPVSLTSRVFVILDCSVKIAVTERAVTMDTMQAPVPEQAPVQPMKLDPDPGVAVNVTEVP